MRSKLGSMKLNILVTLILIFFMAYSSLSIAEEKLLLNLKYNDTEGIKEIKFYGDTASLLSVSLNDTYSLSVNGNFIKLPLSVYRRLNSLRMGFHSDKVSDGILKNQVENLICFMPGVTYFSFELESLYLTIVSSNQVVKSEMRKVFNSPETCIPPDYIYYKPSRAEARESAKAVVEILNMIRLTFDEKENESTLNNTKNSEYIPHTGLLSIPAVDIKNEFGIITTYEAKMRLNTSSEKIIFELLDISN